MNAEQIQEIVRETIRQELAAFFISSATQQRDADYVSPAEEARIRLQARMDLRARSQRRDSHA